MSTRARFLLLLAAALAGAVLVAACPGTRGAGPHLGRGYKKAVGVDAQGRPIDEEGNVVVEDGGGEPILPPVTLEHEDRMLDVTITPATDSAPAVVAHLGAVLVHQKAGDKAPVIVIVPGASDISRKGTRSGDGVSKYAQPVDVYTAWADAFAKRGAAVLAYDKRTCGPNDDPLCAKNPQDDIDAQGPSAMSKDVDAACALAKTEPAGDGRIVLFAHAQAAQVALSSSCAKEAAAIVLLAPIPRAIDEVLVAALKQRADDAQRAAKAAKDATEKATLLDDANQLKNLAGTREAELASIKGGKFAPTAKVMGATIAFWKGWMDLTAKTAALADAVTTPKIVVLGEKDVQYAEKDRIRIRALAPAAFVEVKGADHHLLTDGKLSDDTVDAVGHALDAVLAPKG